MGDAQPRIGVGQRVQTSRGIGTAMTITDYQVRVQPDDGDDAYWTLHRDVQPAPAEDDEREPTVAELLDACAQMLELARVKLAASSTPAAAVVKPSTDARGSAP